MLKYEIYDDTEHWLISAWCNEENRHELGIDDDDDMKTVILDTVNSMVPENYREFIRLNAHYLGHTEPNIGLLIAHGYCENEIWYYMHDNTPTLVENWIKDMDGQCSALVLRCCNPGSCSPTTKNSVLIYPNNVVSMSKLNRGDAGMEIYVPHLKDESGKPLDISSYTIEKDLENFRHLVETRKNQQSGR